MIPEEEVTDKIIFHFISDDPVFDDPTVFKEWLISVAEKEEKQIEAINYIFCDDAYLLEINKKYLDHDEYTDIITFPYNEDPIVSDIYISLERIDENAVQFGSVFMEELSRVMVHGLLHLCGHGDKTEEEKKRMRNKENECLAFLSL